MRQTPLRILIIKPSSLGDIVHTFPAAALIQATIPDVRLDWVANDALAQMVELFPHLHRVIHFPRQHLSLFKPGFIRQFLHELRRDEYDAAIDFQGLLRSGLMAGFTRTPLRFGFGHSREGARYFYTTRVDCPPEIRHAAEKNLYLARSAMESMGFNPPAAMPEARLAIPAAWDNAADELLERLGIPANAPLLAVGCSSRWESKSWPTEFFAKTLRLVAEIRPRMTMWLLGGAGERSRAEDVVSQAALPRLHNLAGLTDLGTLTALLARSTALLTNDSGPMHIAAALGTPCVACFGATSAELTGPYGPPGRHRIIQSKCPQAPCFRRICPRLPGEGPCPQGITPGEAADAILERVAPE